MNDTLSAIKVMFFDKGTFYEFVPYGIRYKSLMVIVSSVPLPSGYTVLRSLTPYILVL